MEAFLMQPWPHHTLQFNKDKIMQITFLSDGLPFFATPHHNCSVLRKLSGMFSKALFFHREPHQSERKKVKKKKNKEPRHVIGLRLHWQPIVKCVKWRFDAGDWHVFFKCPSQHFPRDAVLELLSKLLSALSEATQVDLKKKSDM